MEETLILKFGFKAIFILLGSLGAFFIWLGVMTGVAFLPQPVEFEWMWVRGSIVITNASALIAGFAIAIAYWVILKCISFAFKGILKAVLYEYSRKGQVKPSAQLPQAEFNPLNNIIRSFQREILA